MTTSPDYEPTVAALAQWGVTAEEAVTALRPMLEVAARIWEEQRPFREALAIDCMAEWRRQPWRFDLYRRARVLAS